jgi:hypothetical protein
MKSSFNGFRQSQYHNARRAAFNGHVKHCGNVNPPDPNEAQRKKIGRALIRINVDDMTQAELKITRRLEELVICGKRKRTGRPLTNQ